MREIMTKTLPLYAAALTTAGQSKKVNEDAVFHRTWQTSSGEWAGLYIVCDGLGGHQAGDVASQLALDTVLDELLFFVEGDLTAVSPDTLYHHMQTAVAAANDQIWQQGQTMPGALRRMGTTITLALVAGGVAYIAHVGDSRAYAWRRGKLTQLTEDHSWAASLARNGIISEEEIDTHPRNNVLWRALGQEETVRVALYEWPLQAGDRLLLCSDGLWKAFTNTAELAPWLGKDASPAKLCSSLVDVAQRRDGSDDTSAVVVVTGDTAGQQRDASQQEANPVPAPEMIGEPLL